MALKLFYWLRTKTNHHAGIINLFDVFVESNKITLDSTFKDLVYQINQNEPRGLKKNILRRQLPFSKHRNVQSKRYR
jgi:hypothetical protein